MKVKAIHSIAYGGKVRKVGDEFEIIESEYFRYSKDVEKCETKKGKAKQETEYKNKKATVGKNKKTKTGKTGAKKT